MSKLEGLFVQELARLNEQRTLERAAEAERLAAIPKSEARIKIENFLSLISGDIGFITSRGFSIEDKGAEIGLVASDQVISVGWNNQKYQVSLLGVFKGVTSKPKKGENPVPVPVFAMPVDWDDTDWVETPEEALELVARFLAKASIGYDHA